MKKSFFYTLLFFCSFILFSCEDDPTCNDGIQNGDETGIDCGGSECPACVTTVEEDQANIQETFDELLLCITDIKNARAIDILFKDFLHLSEGEALNKDWIDDLADELDQIIDFEHITENERIDLAYHSGTHIYDIGTDTWTKTNNVDDRVVFIFPSEPSLAANNVEMVLDRYEDTQVAIDGETIYLPTAIHALMTVDGDRLMEVSLLDVVYAENEDFEIPVELTAEIFIDPVTITMTLDRKSTTAYLLNFNIEDADKCTIGFEIDMELKDDDFENLSKDGFEKVHVKVNVGKMTFQSIADIASLISLYEVNDVPDSQINSLLDIDALFDGVKIADIEISQEQETVLIFYKDLSFEDSNIYYETFWEDVKELWKEYFG